MLLPAPREPGVMLATGFLSRAHAQAQAVWGAPCGVILPSHLGGTLEIVSTGQSRSAAEAACDVQRALLGASERATAGDSPRLHWFRIGCDGMLRPPRQMRPVSHALAVAALLEWRLVPEARALALGVVAVDGVVSQLIEAIYLQNCPDAAELACAAAGGDATGHTSPYSDRTDLSTRPPLDAQLGDGSAPAAAASRVGATEVRAALARWLEWAKGLPLLASVHDEFVASRPWIGVSPSPGSKATSGEAAASSRVGPPGLSRGSSAHSLQRYSSGPSNSSMPSSTTASRTDSGRSTPTSDGPAAVGNRPRGVRRPHSGQSSSRASPTRSPTPSRASADGRCGRPISGRGRVSPAFTLPGGCVGEGASDASGRPSEVCGAAWRRFPAEARALAPAGAVCAGRVAAPQTSPLERWKPRRQPGPCTPMSMASDPRQSGASPNDLQIR